MYQEYENRARILFNNIGKLSPVQFSHEFGKIVNDIKQDQHDDDKEFYDSIYIICPRCGCEYRPINGVDKEWIK